MPLLSFRFGNRRPRTADAGRAGFVELLNEPVQLVVEIVVDLLDAPVSW